MERSRIIPYFIAAYVAAVGLFFGSAVIFGLPVFEVGMPGAYYLLGISVLFFALGILFIFLLVKGGLRKKGKTVIEVRLEAVEKMRSQELLAQIAKEDPVKEVREKAKEQLQKKMSEGKLK